MHACRIVSIMIAKKPFRMWQSRSAPPECFANLRESPALGAIAVRSRTVEMRTVRVLVGTEGVSGASSPRIRAVLAGGTSPSTP